MINFKAYFRMLLEGGQAADNLVSDLITVTGNKKLKYVRATVSPIVLDEVQSLLTVLRANKFINAKEPSYVLGSSRLFAIKAGIRAPEPNEIETPDIIDKALQSKKDFGDIDLDVHYVQGVRATDIANFLNNEFTGKYAAAAAGGEVNAAVVVGDSSQVIQIDIVDMAEKEDYFKFNQFSSFADIAVGIKGAVRDLLIRGITATTPIDSKKHENLTALIKNTERYKKVVDKYKPQGPVTFKIRYTLGDSGLAYKITWMVNGKAKSHSEGGIQYNQLQKFVTDGEASNVNYSELQIIANILGFKTPEHTKHVVEMAKLISTFDQQRKQQIWDDITEKIKAKIPKPGKNVGQMSLDDAKSALNYLLPFFGNVTNNDIDNLFTKTSNDILGEAVDQSDEDDKAANMTSIPHIDHMTIKSFCDLFSDSDWEISEKYDGSNVSFGLDRNNNIYIKTKKLPPSADPEVFFELGRRYNSDINHGYGHFLVALNKTDIKNKLLAVQQELGVPVQVFGELFSKAHSNVIAYSPELIGNGAIVIFGVETVAFSHKTTTGKKIGTNVYKGTDITTKKIGKELMAQCIESINDAGTWKAYSKKPIDLKIKDIVKRQIHKACSAESQAAHAIRVNIHTPLERQMLKAKAVQEFVRLKKILKKNLLYSTRNVQSSLGAGEIEGAIIRHMQNGAIAKLVDLEGFSKLRAEEWAGKDALKEYRMKLYTSLKEVIFKNADILVDPVKPKNKIAEYQNTSGNRVTSLDDILHVLYLDAAKEVELISAKKMVDNIVTTLKEYKIDIERAMFEVEQASEHAKKETQNAINVEKQRIDTFIKNLQDSLRNKQNPYLSAMNFLLGHNVIKDLTDAFLRDIKPAV